MWWQLAHNPRIVTAYYSTPPALTRIEINAIRVLRDGPTLELTVDLAQFPDLPSPRWPVGANTAQAVLRFFGLRQIALTGWETNNIGDLTIERRESSIAFRFDSSTSQLSGIADYFDVMNISGYINRSA